VPRLKTDEAFCCVFSDAVSASYYVGLMDLFNAMRKEEVVAKFKVLPRSLDGMRKTRIYLSQCNR
jgi:hypothetical protein